jgi:MOSC domain-containing protein YiiM
MTTPNQALVIAVSRSETHTVQKFNHSSMTLLEGLGVANDAHQGITVKHRSRVAQNPAQPNLRQVHLIHAELHDELKTKGFELAPGQMGENITTRGIDLLGLPRGTKLTIGEAVLEVTGLRNPCTQLDGIQPGLMAAVLDRDEAGNLIRKAGIMTIVLQGGEVKPGDEIRVQLPSEPYQRLERV